MKTEVRYQVRGASFGIYQIDGTGGACWPVLIVGGFATRAQAEASAAGAFELEPAEKPEPFQAPTV